MVPGVSHSSGPRSLRGPGPPEWSHRDVPLQGGLACGAGTAAATLGADLVGHGRLMKSAGEDGDVRKLQEASGFEISTDFIRFDHPMPEIG